MLEGPQTKRPQRSLPILNHFDRISSISILLQKKTFTPVLRVHVESRRFRNVDPSIFLNFYSPVRSSSSRAIVNGFYDWEVSSSGFFDRVVRVDSSLSIRRTPNLSRPDSTTTVMFIAGETRKSFSEPRFYFSSLVIADTRNNTSCVATCCIRNWLRFHPSPLPGS